MINHKKYDCIINIEPKQITFTLSEKKNKPWPQEIEEENIRLQIHIARIFVKLLNFIKEEKDLFQKEDFNLLGDVLGKILFTGDNASRFLYEYLLTMVKLTHDSTCRFYLNFNYNSELTELPWEYIKIKYQNEEEEEEPIYLAANENNRFQLIRQLNRQPVEHGKTERLNLVVVVCDGSNPAEGIYARNPAPLLQVLDELKSTYKNSFHYTTLMNPSKEEFPVLLAKELKKLEKQDGSIPPYLVHYFGHARLKDRQGQLVFNTKTDGIIWIDDKVFAGFFDKAFLTIKAHEEVDVPETVVFQACDSAKIGSLTEGRGVAIAMCQNNIPAVVGMQNEIDVDSSSQFSKEFYESLLKGLDVAEAITNGRFYLGHRYKINSPQDIFGNNLFGSPVLFINTLEPVAVIKKAGAGDKAESTETVILKTKCPQCKRDNDHDARFCQGCGFNLHQLKTDIQPVTPSQVEVADHVQAHASQASGKTARLNTGAAVGQGKNGKASTGALDRPQEPQQQIG